MKESRKLVYETLNGKNTSRAPRDLWLLGWSLDHYPKEIAYLNERYPVDVVNVPAPQKDPFTMVKGDIFGTGEYVDAFGCKFTGIQKGVVGEVKEPLVKSDDWSDADNVHIPNEWLSFDIDEVNDYVANKAGGKFTLTWQYPRPFEQMQFIRGTENLYMDLMDMPSNMEKFIGKLHTFYCDLFEKWGKTDVDAFYIMDDWGSQKSLLINPVLWRKVFKPLYSDYCQIARRYGKKVFMHSDGYILPIMDDLIEIGIDAINSQVFCMGVENLARYKGKITFWGEIDRQHLLVNGTQKDIENAVKSVYDTLWQDGYCFAQCEFGAGANPSNVKKVFETWDNLTKR